MELPWFVIGSLALSIALALIARKPREIDISSWPMQAQVSGNAGIFISLILLLIVAVQVSWWVPAPTIIASVALWRLASLLPRFVRRALEVISILGWPWGIVLAAVGMRQLGG